MLNTNNKVNYEINIKQEEKKYSWSTVFAWLYLKTIGRILPKKWNKWAENILYYDKAGGNGAQTDDLKTADKSASIDLKPEVIVEKSKSEVISKDGEVQTNRVTFQDIAMQTECIEAVDKGFQADLGSEREKKLENENEELKEQLEGVNQAIKTFIGLCNNQAQQIADLQLENDFLEEENGKLKSIIEGLKKNYRELAEVAKKRGEEFLAKLEEKSKEILKLNKELIECSTEFANKTEKLSVEAEEKDAKINSLTWLNERLDEDKKEMEAKNNEQQRTISEKDQRIKEQDALIKSLTGKNKDISEAVKKDNESLRIQITELESKVSELKGESDTKTADIKQLEGKLNELEQQKQQELEQTQSKNAELESKVSELRKEKAQNEEQLKTMEEERNEVSKLQKQVQILKENKEWGLAGIDDSLKETFLVVIELLAQQLPLNNQEQQLQGKKVNLEDKLKILISQLNAAEEEKQILEGNKAEEIERLTSLKKKSDEDLQETREKLAEQEKLVEQLQKEQKQVESQLKADIKRLQEEKENMEKQLKIMQQQLLNNQKQQKVGKELKDVNKRLEDIGKTKRSQEQTKDQRSSIVSLRPASTAKSITESTLSKWRNLPNKLFGDKNLNNFLSRKNEELKKGFPEFKEKHFCHNVLNKTIEFLRNQGDGKFESSKLLKLLENNMKESAREIIKDKVREVVNEHCNVEKNIGKELRDDTLKAKLSSSVGKCIEKSGLNKKDAAAITDSIWHSFHSRNNNNDDSGKLLKEIFVEELTKARVKSFSSKIQELQLASSIRDKFLSPDQGMCNKTQGNEYQLTERAKKEYIPNTSMTDTNSTASIRSLNGGRVVRVGS